MNLLSSLLPGFREVRAPLVSGYLWLFLLWLLLEARDALPTKSDGELYRDLFRLGDLIGPVGLAAVASVIAYVAGSLVTQVLRWLWGAPEQIRETLRPRVGFGQAVTHFGIRTYVPLVHVLSGYEPTRCGRLERTWRVVRSLEEVAERETATARERLRAACAAAQGHVDSASQRPASEAASVRGRAPDLFALESSPRVEFRLPRLSGARDIFGERRAILARLMDVSPFIGSKIDRLEAESEFRFAVAWPLLAVLVAFSATTDESWWLLLIPIPLLLLVHGVGLHRDAALELVDALRTRTGASVTELTPAYERYHKDAKTLAQSIEEMDWAQWSKRHLEDERRDGSSSVRGGVDDGGKRSTSQAERSLQAGSSSD